MPEPEHAPPIKLDPHTEWYHGSPQRLQTLTPGSTVTPVLELAKAFAHKPTNVNIQIRENESGRTVTIGHDGELDGYLYRVVVADPAKDLRPHPQSTSAPGEEMLTTRELAVEFLEELPIRGV